MPGKYERLADYLDASRRSGVRSVTMTFVQIEAIIGLHLPASARTQRAWWRNTTSRATPEWEAIADLRGKTVVFTQSSTR